MLRQNLWQKSPLLTGRWSFCDYLSTFAPFPLGKILIFTICPLMMHFTSSAEIEGWLNNLQLLKTTRVCETPLFIKPFHLATLAHVLRTENISQLTLPGKIGDYADTMMLWEALGIQSPFPEKNRQPRGRYHPVVRLQNRAAIDEVAEALGTLFTSVCAGERTVDAVRTMLRELIDNCYSHSSVSDGLYGLICAQIWNGGRKAQIALSDSGVGIRTSLKDNALLHARLNNENSCKMATEFGVTGKPGRGHSGYGLHVARGLLTNNNGMLYVRSGSEAFSLSQNLTNDFYTKSVWNGTLVVIEWDLDRPVDISDVYKNMPLPEGIDDDDFFD